jgi:hypothetical protein
VISEDRDAASYDLPRCQLTPEERDAWHYELWQRAGAVKHLEEILAKPDWMYRASGHPDFRPKPWRYTAARLAAAICARDAVAAEYDRLMGIGPDGRPIP